MIDSQLSTYAVASHRTVSISMPKFAIMKANSIFKNASLNGAEKCRKSYNCQCGFLPISYAVSFLVKHPKMHENSRYVRNKVLIRIAHAMKDTYSATKHGGLDRVPIVSLKSGVNASLKNETAYTTFRDTIPLFGRRLKL